MDDGVHLVGTNATRGAYSANGVERYYVWKTSTGADAQIVDNNIVTGPVTVTLVAGQTFETTSCGTWTKVG